MSPLVGWLLMCVPLSDIHYCALAVQLLIAELWRAASEETHLWREHEKMEQPPSRQSQRNCPHWELRDRRPSYVKYL